MQTAPSTKKISTAEGRESRRDTVAAGRLVNLGNSTSCVDALGWEKTEDGAAGRTGEAPRGPATTFSVTAVE